VAGAAPASFVPTCPRGGDAPHIDGPRDRAAIGDAPKNGEHGYAEINAIDAQDLLRLNRRHAPPECKEARVQGVERIGRFHGKNPSARTAFRTTRRITSDISLSSAAAHFAIAFFSFGVKRTPIWLARWDVSFFGNGRVIFFSS
jgi:hypothetical protein